MELYYAALGWQARTRFGMMIACPGREARRRRVDDPCGKVADANIREVRPVDFEAGTVDDDPPALDGPARLDGGDSGC